jgi:hypothetical protein
MFGFTSGMPVLSIDGVLILKSILHCFDHGSFVVKFGNKEVLNSLLFFSVQFGCLGSFAIHVSCRMTFSISAQNIAVRILIEI